LPTEIQIALRANLIKMGHARALISISDSEQQKSLLEDILENDYSVRQVERLVKEILDGGAVEDDMPSQKSVDATASVPKPDYEGILWEEKFSAAYKRQVKVKLGSNGKGQIIVPFKNKNDLEQFFKSIR